jgi:hypothetical protein
MNDEFSADEQYLRDAITQLQRLKTCTLQISQKGQYDPGVSLYGFLYYNTNFYNLDNEKSQKRKLKNLNCIFPFIRRSFLKQLFTEIITLINTTDTHLEKQNMDIRLKHHSMFKKILPEELYDEYKPTLPELTSLAKVSHLTTFLIRIAILLLVDGFGYEQFHNGSECVKSFLSAIANPSQAKALLGSFRRELSDALLGRGVFSFFNFGKKLLLIKRLRCGNVLFSLDESGLNNSSHCYELAHIRLLNDFSKVYVQDKGSLLFGHLKINLNEMSLKTGNSDMVKRTIILNKMFKLGLGKLLAKDFGELNKLENCTEEFKMFINKNLSLGKLGALDFRNAIDICSRGGLTSIESLAVLVLSSKLLNPTEYSAFVIHSLMIYFEKLKSVQFDRNDLLALAWLIKFVPVVDITIEYLPLANILTEDRLKALLNYMVSSYNYTLNINKQTHDEQYIIAIYSSCNELINIIPSILYSESLCKLVLNIFYLFYSSFTLLIRKSIQPTILPYCFNCYGRLEEDNITKLENSVYICNYCFSEHLYLKNKIMKTDFMINIMLLKDLSDRLQKLSVGETCKDSNFLKLLNLEMLRLLYHTYQRIIAFKQPCELTIYYFLTFIEDLQLNHITNFKLYSEFMDFFGEMKGELYLTEQCE